MNVIVANEKKVELSNLDIDVIKNINGIFSAEEIVEMFKSFFYSKMIIDVTALKNYEIIKTYQTLSMELNADKIIFYLKEGTSVCTTNFLSNLISIGIYNFTTNIEGVKYLLTKSNTYKDVAKIQNLTNESNLVNNLSNSKTNVIGFKNVTESAGATTLIYMLKKTLETVYGNTIIAIEVNKNDFTYLRDNNMFSSSSNDLAQVIKKYEGAPVILIDLNDSDDDSSCGEIIYMIEPSTIKLNKLMRRTSGIFKRLQNKKILLNKSLLSNKDIEDFEYEAKVEVFYNMPPLDERKKNDILLDFLMRLGLVEKSEENTKEGNRIFGLFRR